MTLADRLYRASEEEPEDALLARARPKPPKTDSSFLGILDAPETVDPRDFSTSLSLTRQQRVAERSARREIRRLEFEFRLLGKEDEFEKFAEQEGRLGVGGFIQDAAETALDPIFDLLSIGNYTIAGITQEILRTNSSWEAAKQGALELANALPVVDLKEYGAREPSFIDIFKEHGASRWSSMIGGLALDIFLDPLNLVPGFAIAKGVAHGGRAALKASRGLGKVLEFTFVPNSYRLTKAGMFYNLSPDLVGLGATARFKDLAKQQGITDPQVLESLGDAGKAVVEFGKKYGREAQDRTLELWGRVDQLLANMTSVERRIFGSWMDQPNRMKEELHRMAEAGMVDSEKIPYLLEQADLINGLERKGHKSFSDQLFDERVSQGIIDERAHVDFYLHATDVVDPRQARGWGKAMKERKLPLSKKGSQADRIIAAVKGEGRPPETDIGSILYTQSADHVKQVNFRNLLRTVVSDGRISALIRDLDDDFFKTQAKWDKEKAKLIGENPGFDVLEVKKTIVKDGKKSEEVVGGYLMPDVIVHNLTRIDNTLKDKGAVGWFFDQVDSITSPWRGWATLSPGYHARNYGGGLLFMNWMAGVGADYSISAMRRGDIPKPGEFILRHLQAMRLQVMSQGGGRMPKRFRDLADKVAIKAGFKSFDKIAMPVFEDHSGKVWDLSKEDDLLAFTRLGEAEDVPQTATKIYDLPADTEKHIWSGIEDDIVDIGAMKKAGVSQVTRAALATGKKQKRNARERLSLILGNDNPFLKANRAFSQIVENNGRWALYLDRMMKKAPSSQAGQATKTWHFDYRNLTEIEKRIFRNLMPFYAWQRFSVPRMLMAMVEQPGRFSKIPKIKNAIESLSEQWGDLPTPDYYDEVQALQLPAIHRDRPLFAQLDFPFMELNRLNKKDVAASLHPMVKMFFESIPSGGHSFFVGAPIETFPGEESEGLPFLSKMTESQLTNIFPPAGKYGTRLARSAKRGELTEQVVSEFTGVRFRALDVRRVTRARTFERRKLAVDFKKRLIQDGLIRK